MKTRSLKREKSIFESFLVFEMVEACLRRLQELK